MRIKKIVFYLLFSAVSLLIFGGAVQAQDDQTDTRSITSLDFKSQRSKTGNKAPDKTSRPPSTPAARKKIAVITNSKRKYNRVKKIPPRKAVVPQFAKSNGKSGTNTGKSSNQKPLKTEELGVTFWRLRPKAADEDDAPEFPVRLGERIENWTAERVNSTTRFTKGDRVRFTIEASRSGFLYIVNREFYSDGTSGEANIIFPTLRTRGGDNQVVAGSLIDIPASTDSVPYFTVKPKREDYGGEELLVVISPVKLPIEIGMRAQPVTRETVEKWLDDWGAEVDVFDAEDGEGIAVTKIEAEAVNSRALTQEEPLPQTIYRVKIREGEPLIVPFQMMAKIP